MEAGSIRIAFAPRPAPLEAVAVVGGGATALALARRLSVRDDAHLAALNGVAAGDAFVVLGEHEALPWVDGAIYLGRDPRAPHLLLPTTLGPVTVAPEVFEAAVLRRAGALSPPLAVIPSPSRIFSVAAARSIARSHLARWLEAHG